MPYTPQTWANLPATTTPLSAARLAHMEDGIEDADTRLVSVESDRLVVRETAPNVKEERFGAKGDASTDDSAAIQAALNAYPGRYVEMPSLASGLYYKTLTPITIPARTGQGSAVVRKTNGDTNGDTVFICGEDCEVRNVQAEGPTPVHFLAVVYPTGTNNPSYGFRSAKDGGGLFTDSAGGVVFDHATARYFSKAGIGGKYDVAKVLHSSLHQNLHGIERQCSALKRLCRVFRPRTT